jgi:hypothetical protein
MHTEYIDMHTKTHKHLGPVAAGAEDELRGHVAVLGVAGHEWPHAAEDPDVALELHHLYTLLQSLLHVALELHHLYT